MIQFAILCGLTGHVFIHILCADGEVFGFWPKLLRKVLFGSTAIHEFEDMKWWQLYIYKPLAGCGVCNSGWIAIIYWQKYGQHNFFTFIFFVCGAVFTAWVLEKVRDFVIERT